MRCGQSGGKKHLAVPISIFLPETAFHLLYPGEMGIFFQAPWRLGSMN
jgi:hypothetical protein